MNILLTCAGRRSHFIEMFKEAVKDRGQVFACDASADAPALREADEALVVPAVSDPGYVDALVALCETHRIGLLIPALEPELPLLAEQRARFAAIGTVVLVSSPEIIATCYDKMASARFLARHGLAVPRTFLTLAEARQALARAEIHFPLVVKPRWGVSSIATEFPEDDEELELAWRLARKQLGRSLLAEISATDPERCVLIQEKLAGTEYGLDIVNDLDGRYVATFVKRKLRIRCGQTDRAVTVQDDRLEALGRCIGRNLRHIGLLDCDVVVAGEECHAIDLNPRFGGGYSFSHLAGADIPAALLAWARGGEANPLWFQMEPGVTAARSDVLIVTSDSALALEAKGWA
ncbi:MAG: carbamoyl-phosphate synthase large subunit [Chthoniobacter sp.]|jgi:carbamoyl-phosphate synthase large subunit|nr:carbamoyl-phosphate synthase large subunit [Chthoniobacter sp.]